MEKIDTCRVKILKFSQTGEDTYINRVFSTKEKRFVGQVLLFFFVRHIPLSQKKNTSISRSWDTLLRVLNS